MRSITTVLAWLCAVDVALAQTTYKPTSTSAGVPEASAEAVRLVGFDECSTFQMNFIKAAFDEFMVMVPEEYNSGTDESGPSHYYPWIDWQSAPAIDFLGPANRGKEYRSKIQGEFV